MIVLGLTGSIGMGKSTTAKLFQEEGVPVHDADAAVHDLYDVGGPAVAPVGAAFPGVVVHGRVDRERLAAEVVGKPQALKRLEAIVHPLVTQHRAGFLKRVEAQGARVAVLDVPLLFETGGHDLVDAVVVVSAPIHIQRDRVMARPGMTAEKFEAILARQAPDAEKRARAGYVVDTSRGIDEARDQVRAILTQLRPTISGEA
jgi:dephospho-CoA kinase